MNQLGRFHLPLASPHSLLHGLLRILLLTDWIASVLTEVNGQFEAYDDAHIVSHQVEAPGIPGVQRHLPEIDR